MLRAVQVVVDEGLARPILVGRAEVIAARIERLGLRIDIGSTCEVVDVLGDPRIETAADEYYQLTRRRGVSMAVARETMRSRATPLAAMLLRRGDADAMLCGTVGAFNEHLHFVRDAIGCRSGVLTLAAMNMLMLPDRQIFICDTYVNRNPTPIEIAEITMLAAEEIRRFGLTPVAALLSHSSFGSSHAPEALLMREARTILLEHDPDLAVEGEMQGDAACRRRYSTTHFPTRASPPRRTCSSCPMSMPPISPTIC